MSDIPSVVQVRSLNGNDAFFPNCPTILSLRVAIAKVHQRLASDVLLLTGSTVILFDDIPPPAACSVILKNEESESTSATLVYCLRAHSQYGDADGLQRLCANNEGGGTPMSPSRIMRLGGELLCEGIRAADMVRTTALLTAKIGLQFVDAGTGETVIHVAARHASNNHTALLALLLAHVPHKAFFVNQADVWGYTALHMCAIIGYTSAAQVLIDASASVNIASKGEHIAHIPTWNAYIRRKRIDDMICSTSHACTPLYEASGYGHDSLVQLLLTARAEVNLGVTTSEKYTPLHIAAKRGYARVVSVLLPYLQSRPNTEAGGDQILDPWALWSAVECGHESVIALLLDARASIDDTNEKSQTILHRACVAGVPPAITRLIASQEKKKKKKKDGRTPLHLAALHGKNSEAIGVLLAANVVGLLDAREKTTGRTALHLAARSGHLGVVDALLTAEPSLAHVVDAHGRLPLHLAALRGCTEVAMRLLQVCNDSDATKIANARDADGLTPLHVVAHHGYHKLVTLLVQARARIDNDTVEVNDNHCPTELTPLQLAAQHGHSDVVASLLACKASVNVRAGGRGRGRYSVLRLAQARGHKDVLDVLLTAGAEDWRECAEVMWDMVDVGRFCLVVAAKVLRHLEGIVREYAPEGMVVTISAIVLYKMRY
eukprot:GEMP01017996.1.p1 GENE.GEMP01017996.1~~GEMP01017996.1.p1  ORF type:complete len:662 (+),score=185.54 GEMP01017996.1:261-2246(+)